MDEELRSLTERLRQESGASAVYDRLMATEDLDELAGVLTEPGQPLWARELAAFRLGLAGDGRSFEALVLLLNHRDPPRCAFAALATNELRVAYALHPVRLLTRLRAPESVPALITTLERRLRPRDPYRKVA